MCKKYNCYHKNKGSGTCKRGKKLKIEISLNNMYVIWTSSIDVFSIHCASLTLNYFFSAQYTLISHYITRIIINEANFGV